MLYRDLSLFNKFKKIYYDIWEVKNQKGDIANGRDFLKSTFMQKEGSE